MKTVKSLLLILAAAAAVSCESVLDVKSPDYYSESVIWSGNQETFDSYTIGNYGGVRDRAEFFGLNSKFTDALTDIIKSGDWNSVQRYNRCMIWTSEFTTDKTSILDCWDEVYIRVKRYNEWFANLEKYRSNFKDQNWLAIREAETHFLRAYSYYYLARVWGGVVIRKDLDGPDQNDKPISSEADTWQFIIDELQLAAPVLPVAWPDRWRGRATRAAAYGLLSRVALYAKQWDVAIEAAEQCAAAGGALDPDFSNIFSNERSVENLFVVEFFTSNIASNLTVMTDEMFRPKGDEAYHNAGGRTILSWLVPTSELADEFEMADGTPFSWEAHGADPYNGRDPRFYSTILYNGAPWEGRTIETYVGGADGYKKFDKSEIATTVTGYYLRKFLVEGDHSWDTYGTGRFEVLIRYGEVLLNEAEALAQEDWASNKTAALAALNELRSVRGMPAKNAATLDDFMALIEHERMVELAGEGFRFWDLRRWRRAVDVLDNINVNGMKITKNNDGTFTYEKEDADAGEKRHFFEKYYAFSIPQSERSRNGAVKNYNNPGW
ncbi:MAG: RagB/SusD family nutrient uptake outer membrane protein [Bacteroidales bacterium]|nr:RagB/SusD family nutrient uptake outer membrane protein [Bacteroidales bacterium]